MGGRWHNITARCDENVVNWSVHDLAQTYLSWLYVCVAVTKKTRRGNIFLSTSADSDLNMIRCQQICVLSLTRRAWIIGRSQLANGQFTTASPQRSETLMTLSQTSGQVTVPRVRVGITVFCIVALPRDRLGVTARDVNRRTVICVAVTVEHFN